ncbi:MAG: DUF58 domain-containing protein [Caulobacteraceae bacterium]|nr:DUF58 domain-containing protein [Caulobacteraceae bacterium]
MIYPTARAVGLAALGAPVALLLGVAAPKLWLIGAAWIAVCAAALLLDAVLAADPRKAELDLSSPVSVPVGAPAGLRARAAFAGANRPAVVELALETCERLTVQPRRATARAVDGVAAAGFAAVAPRRGRAVLRRLQARWRGPFGLVWRQAARTLDRDLLVTLDVGAVKDEALALFSRDVSSGLRLQLDLGGGAEFHALTEFRSGMDRRTIDWKQSARHQTLLAKEFRAERNHHVIAAIDTGRLMGQPLGGLPRLDHALRASLLLAYAGLRMGDRMGVFGFGARPNVSAPAVAGASAFAGLQALITRIDYSTDETNYTLGLTQLASQLRRRSLIVIFTDFADTTSAELMLENVGRLLRQHLVLFVLMRDEELEDLERKAPQTPEDVSRAVVAGAMLRERELVVGRLRRMGAQIVEGPAGRIGPALVARYLDLKQRDLL